MALFVLGGATPFNFFGGYGSVSGTVTNDAAAPVARKVRVFDRHTGKLIGETVSDATTGAYTISNLRVGLLVTVIFYDNEAGVQYNAVVYDRVTV